jgi:hypothetical protein
MLTPVTKGRAMWSGYALTERLWQVANSVVECNTWTVKIELQTDVRACTVHITTTITSYDNGSWQPYDAFSTTNADHGSPSVFNWIYPAAATDTCNARLIYSTIMYTVHRCDDADIEPPRREALLNQCINVESFLLGGMTPRYRSTSATTASQVTRWKECCPKVESLVEQMTKLGSPKLQALPH